MRHTATGYLQDGRKERRAAARRRTPGMPRVSHEARGRGNAKTGATVVAAPVEHYAFDGTQRLPQRRPPILCLATWGR